MPEAIAPTPVAPAPAPSPAPTAPSPAPSVPRWEADIDKLSDEPKAPEKPIEKTPEKAPEKPEAPKDEPKEPGKEPEKKPEAKTPEKMDDKTRIPAFQTNKDLRKWAEERHRTALGHEAKLAQYESELAKLKQTVPQNQQDATLLTKQIADMTKQVQQYEELLATHVYGQSPAYQKDYEKPYQDARERAYKEVAELLVNEATGEKDAEDKPILRQRPATKRDFDYIYSLPRAQARKAAKELFGEDADEVMEHRKKIGELAEKAVNALNEHKTTYEKRKEEELGKQRTSKLAQDQLWRSANEKISQDPKRTAFWGEDKDDPEANQHLASGFQVADLFFSEERDKMTPEERVAFDANVRHRIAGFSKLAYVVKKLRAELGEKDNEIAELRGSSPGAPKPSGPAPVKRKGLMEAIDEVQE